MAAMTTTRHRQSAPPSSLRRPRWRPTRPSLLLWRHRHLVVAVCLGAAVVVALSVLRPGPPPAQEVLVAVRPVGAGEILTEDDVDRRRVPVSALPESGLAGPEALGSRCTIPLEPGTVLTTSMTGAALTQGLSPSERVVQVPVEVGAALAEPGARVDVIGEAPSAGSGETAGGPASPGGAGAEEEAQPQVQPAAWGTSAVTVLTRDARVLATQSTGDDDQWAVGAKVTLVTLAIPKSDATLVAGAATNGALGIVLSP